MHGVYRQWEVGLNSLLQVTQKDKKRGMDVSRTPTNGKICYVEIPATDIARSADFYARVFGWGIRRRGDGATAFDDSTGQVSGTWVLGRPPLTQPGLLLYIMVDS